MTENDCKTAYFGTKVDIKSFLAWVFQVCSVRDHTFTTSYGMGGWDGEVVRITDEFRRKIGGIISLCSDVGY